MLNLNLDPNRTMEDRIENIQFVMEQMARRMGRGSRSHIKFLRDSLIEFGYKSHKHINKAIKVSKKFVQYHIYGNEWRKMDEVDYCELLIKIRIGVMKPMIPMAVPWS